MKYVGYDSTLLLPLLFFRKYNTFSKCSLKISNKWLEFDIVGAFHVEIGLNEINIDQFNMWMVEDRSDEYIIFWHFM
jgi:hypothetical protein